MREIPPLRILCLRSIGPHGCNAEATFSPRDEDGKQILSSASRLLRSFHRRPVASPSNAEPQDLKACNLSDDIPPIALDSTPIHRLEYVGPNSARRVNPNDVDIVHPFIASIYPPRRSKNLGENRGDFLQEEEDDDDEHAVRASLLLPRRKNEILAIENGNAALDCLQSYIDSLVELGRMDDARLGKWFFNEWKVAVCEGIDEGEKDEEKGGKGQSSRTMTSVGLRKRKLGNQQESVTAKSYMSCQPRLSSLALHNCASISDATFHSMTAQAKVGSHIGVLDLTGVHSLTDSILEKYVVRHCPSLYRLSLKNCRKITGRGLKHLAKLTKLQCLDVGGSFNVNPTDVIELVKCHPGTADGSLNELYVAGLGWTDPTLSSLMEVISRHVRGLSIGFSPNLTASGITNTLSMACMTLERLALHFCDNVDNAVMTTLGKNLPDISVLDVRGCGSVSTLTGFYDARASIVEGSFRQLDDRDDVEEDADHHLFVLARYSGITKSSLEETRRVHPHAASESRLTCILDSSGFGDGIRR